VFQTIAGVSNNSGYM